MNTHTNQNIFLFTSCAFLLGLYFLLPTDTFYHKYSEDKNSEFSVVAENTEKSRSIQTKLYAVNEMGILLNQVRFDEQDELNTKANKNRGAQFFEYNRDMVNTVVKNNNPTGNIDTDPILNSAKVAGDEFQKTRSMINTIDLNDELKGK